MTISELIEAMMAAGAPMDAVLIAVRAMEIKDADLATMMAAAAEKRAGHAAWKKKRRAELASMDIPRTVDGQSTDCPDQPLSLDKETSPRPPKEINLSPGVNTPARKDRVFLCPIDVDPQHWSDFLANRKRKRLASTVTAYRGQLKALAALSDDEWPPGRIVEFAAQRGWGAFFDPRQHHGNLQNGSNRQGSGARAPRVDGFTAALRQVADSEA